MLHAADMATATQIPTLESLDPTGADQMHQYDSTHENIAVHSSIASSSQQSLVGEDSVSSAYYDPGTTIPKRRSSVFFEEGLKGEDVIVDARLRRSSRPSLRVRFRSKVDVLEPEQTTDFVTEPEEFTATLRTGEIATLFPTMSRLMFFALVLAVMIPSFGNSPFFKAGITPIGAKAGPIKVPIEEHKQTLPAVQKRQDSDTEICKRWSGQSAVVNGTMYYYGGRKSTSADQTTNEWSKYSSGNRSHCD